MGGTAVFWGGASPAMALDFTRLSLAPPPAAGFGAYRGGVPSQGHTAAVEKSWHRFRASLAPPNTLPGLVVYR